MAKVIGILTQKGVKGVLSQGGAYNWDYYWLSRFVSGLALSQTDDDVILTWVNNGTVDWDYILIERKLSGGDYAQIAQITKTLETYTDEDFTVEGTYYYRIRLIKGTHYSSYCTAISIAVSLAPDGAPSALKVIGITDSTQTFEFTPGSTNHDGHRLYMSTDGGVNYTLKASVLGATSTIQATGLTAGALYYFYVVAYKGSTESTATNIYDTYFKITIDTTKAGSANDTFILPTSNQGVVNYYINWGDGSAEQNVTVNTSQTHTYSASGIYQLKMRGTMVSLYTLGSSDYKKITSIDNWGNIRWQSSCKNFFHSCSNLIGKYIDVPNLSAVTTLEGFFTNNALFNSPIKNWSIPLVQSLKSLLAGASIFNSELSLINGDKVTTCYAMLQLAVKFNQPINFNFPLLEDCTRMLALMDDFNSSVTLTTSKVTNMSLMLASSLKFKQPLDFDITSLTDATDMFKDVTLPITVYNDLLVDWAAQNVKDNVPFSAGKSYMLYGSDGQTSRTHLKTAHSWIITDEGHTFDNGKICFTFDDEYDSQYAAVPGVLASESVKGTFYICTDHVGTTGYATWANLQTLAAAGHDVQCHSKTHTNFSTLTDAQILAELTGAEDAFTANSLTSPIHTAYPQGACTLPQSLVVATKRTSGRGIIETPFTSGHNPYFIPSYIIDPTSVPGGDAVAKAKSIIDYVKANNMAATTYCHQFNGTGWLSTAQFTEIVQYAKSEGVDILTISELYALLD